MCIRDRSKECLAVVYNYQLYHFLTVASFAFFLFSCTFFIPLASTPSMFNNGNNSCSNLGTTLLLHSALPYGNGLGDLHDQGPVSYTHLRAHETSLHLVCRLLLEKKKKKK
eukprot:TRINITY_DN10806_c0_g1_i13.p1 TRINITY_DN10806_c0_g1~~TRINITY_DN10806_c0_g1_i13.p1  ORF type:complete len:111 (+),score=17.90 TRINITY_DN10806_c0_g1_i13:76-408(+)